MTIHVLLTADNHLDPPAVHYGPKASERKRDFQKCFETVVNFAMENRPDLLLLGGDLYDGLSPSNPTRTLVSDQFKLLYEKGVKILLVGGQHDTPDNPQAGASPLAVHAKTGHAYFFHEQVPISKKIEIDGTTVSITGLGLDHSASVDRDPLAQQEIRRDGDINILLTHYPLNGSACHSTPEAHVDPTSIPANYHLFASGHLHRYQKRVVNGTPVIYPGSTERTSFQEENETKGFVWLEIDRTGVLHDEFIQTGARPMETLDFHVSDGGNLTGQIRDVLERQSHEQKIVRVRVSGKVSLGQLSTYKRSELMGYGHERFFHVEFDEDELSVLGDTLPEDPPRTSPLQELDHVFTDFMRTAADDKKPLILEAWKQTSLKLQEEGFS